MSALHVRRGDGWGMAKTAHPIAASTASRSPKGCAGRAQTDGVGGVRGVRGVWGFKRLPSDHPHPMLQMLMHYYKC